VVNIIAALNNILLYFLT